MLEILTDENKLLRRKSKRVSRIDDVIRNLSVSLIETMIANDGVGLAAPQCGILKQIIVVLIGNQPKVLINPEVVTSSKEIETIEEGCLSIPDTYILKQRYKKITVKYRDLRGHPKLETYENLDARIIQHEIDHLLGVLMTDD